MRLDTKREEEYRSREKAYSEKDDIDSLSNAKDEIDNDSEKKHFYFRTKAF